MAEDTRDLSFLPGDYELDTFTVSRINEDISMNYCLDFVLQLN